MTSSSIWKLNALIKKNLLEMKRNIFSTLCEILFPIILMLLLYWLKTAFDITNYVFEDVEGSIEQFIAKRSFSNIDMLTALTQRTGKWNGMSILPALFICSRNNTKRKVRPKIATIGVPDQIKERLINDSLLYKDFINFSLDWESFKNFKSEEEMNDYITSKLYGEVEPLICFGMSFEEDNNHNYNYSLHYFENSQADGAQDVPKSLYLIDQFQSGPDMNSYQRYQYSGYTYMMKVVSDYILSQEINNDTKINFGIVPMRYKSYRNDPFGSVVGFLGPFFIIIAYMGHLCIYVYRMVLEKETKVKEGMKIMGLTEGIYFLSYFIQYTVISLVDSAINAVIFLFLFTRIPFIVFFLIFFLFSLNVFALSFFFQSFINKAKESLILSMLLYFVMFFLSLLVMNDDASYNMKMGLSIFPPVTIYLGIILLGKFESHFRTFYLKDIFFTFTNYSVLIMFIMLIADLLIYLFLGYYLQNILPQGFGVRKKWYFIFTRSFWGCKKKRIINNNITNLNSTNNKDELIIGNDTLENNNFQSEDIYKEMTNPKDTLKIRELVKRFDDGKVAVDHVNLNFYKNEIFALLGHNGAGKTTLISMLTGLYEATEGEAIYDGMNILLPENIEEFREKVGICPQHDVLFNDLNIREHLGMFAIFKGVSTNNVENEINKIIKDFQLEDVEDKIAKNLSAGQRRKLSIAISLIGGSEIIFLDEPSSGMDITSRRNLWEILKRQTENKIIILTTHYMEEASVLGKRIGIISLGKMKCIGTPLFLIEKFGKYMNITLVKEEGAINEDIIHFINNNISDAQFESLSEEIMVRIPKNNFGKEGVSLNSFFENLDQNLNELKIKSYSVSMPTLEDVFLNVAADDEKGRLSLQLELQKKNDMTLFNLNYLDDFKNRSKFISDFKANFIRRFFLTIRDKKGIIMEVLCPILLVLIGSLISQVQFYYYTPIFETKDISSIGRQYIYFADINNNSSKVNDYFINDYQNITSKYLTQYKDYIDIVDNNKTLAIKNFINCIYDLTINTESTSDNDIDMNSEDYIGYYGHLLLLNEPNEKNKNYEFIELVNSRVIHGVPIYTSAFLETIINKASENKVNINYKHKVMPKTAKQDMSSNTSGTVVFFVAIAFSLIPANFITIIVREKNNNSKHLMRLSGMNILSYWIVNFIFELFKYYFTGGICMLILYAFDYYQDYLIYFYLLYGPPLILMTYVVSFLFKDESGAQNKMILIHSLIGALGSNVIIILRGIEKTEMVGKILEFIFCLLPSFSFSFAYNLSFSKLSIYMMDFPNEWMHFDGTEMIREYLLLKAPLVYLMGEIGLFMIILILIEVFSYCNICTSNENAPLINNIQKRDSGVVKEELRAQKNIKNIDGPNKLEEETNIDNNDLDNDNNQEKLISTNSENQEENFMVRVKGLRKIYQTSLQQIFFCCFKNKGKPALKNLNFCLEKGECFGLLGLNGAGKTTTFKCITQEISPTNGEIFLNGKKTNDNFGEIKNKFGYCPQYDAIFEYMSVYENLEFYSKLKGVKQEFLESLINAVIYEMRLEEFIKKMAGRLSGGNKRKLSVAISMICNPPIILLDEPSTGMDPEARRFMWSIIHKMSTMGRKSSVIMTTHSMDEAETLCKRMGIMVNGEFVCLGKANEIKNKYGYGYELNLRIKPMSEEQEEELYFKKYNIDRNMKINMQNLENVLNSINKSSFIDEIALGRLGEKLIRDMEKNSNGISINSLISWIFYVQNAIKFIEYGRDNFSKIIIEENMDNNFLFKMKKLENDNKSIGFLFGLFETHKDECFITEYSIQQTSLEQIFNSFAQNQKSMLSERCSTIVEAGDVENISMSANERKRFLRREKILLTDLLSDKLLGIEE